MRRLDASGGLYVEYDAELFNPHTIEGLAGTLGNILRHVTLHPHTPVAAVPLLDAAGASSLVSQFSCAELRPEYLAGPRAHQLFEATAATSLSAACLLFEGEVLSYQQVGELGGREEGLMPD